MCYLDLENFNLDEEMSNILYHIFLPCITFFNLLKSEDFKKTIFFYNKFQKKNK